MYKNILSVNKNNIGVLFSKELNLSRHLRKSFSLNTFNQSTNLNRENEIGYRENFASRHIGIDEKNEKIMLKTLKLNVRQLS